MTNQSDMIDHPMISGCQVVTMIETALIILEKLNEKYPCQENLNTLHCLKGAIYWQGRRTKDREQRGVEGASQA